MQDYVYAFGFGFAIPDKVNIDGIQVDLNWVGQNAGTGTLSTASLYYLGNNYGTPKFPAILNQSFASDSLVGSSGDTWGATLTPAIVNDPSFGFGVQITKQVAGGSDRSFINSMAITVYYSTQDAVITPTASLDPQVDKIDFYRQSGGLSNFTYVGTGQNTATAFNDLLSDLAVATNPLLEYDNFEPFPSIDLPKSGVVNITSSGAQLRLRGPLQHPLAARHDHAAWLSDPDSVYRRASTIVHNRVGLHEQRSEHRAAA